MRIGINCLQVYPYYFGGVNTYTFGLLDGFAKAGTNHTFQIYTTRENRYLFEKYKPVLHFEIIETPLQKTFVKDTFVKKILYWVWNHTNSKEIYRRISNLMYRHIAGFMDSNSDITYTPTTVLFPYCNQKPTLLSMHDIQQVHYPEFFSQEELRIREITYGISAERATFFQASSEFIKEDLLKHFKNLKPEQIVVIPQGVNIEAFSRQTNTEEILNKYNIPRDFIFYPSQLWKHKNHITVLKALKTIEFQTELKIPMVMTGEKYSGHEEIFRFIKENKMNYISYIGSVPFKDLTALYKAAKLLITAALYESSSLTVLEGAASGLPIIASKTPYNEEMAEILKLNLFNPLNVQDLVNAILKLWNGNADINEQIIHNRENIAYYSWENAARRYLRFIGEKI